MILSQLRILYLLGIEGGIPYRIKPAQVLCFEGVSVEEYLDDIFKSKRRYSCVLLLEMEESTSFQEAIDSPNHKEWMEAMRDEMDSMARNKV